MMKVAGMSAAAAAAALVALLMPGPGARAVLLIDDGRKDIAVVGDDGSIVEGAPGVLWLRPGTHKMAGDDGAVNEGAPNLGAAANQPDAAGQKAQKADDAAHDEKTDVVTTAAGDRLTGTVVGIEPGGRLRLKGPQFESDVVVSTAAVDGVVLRGGRRQAGSDRILLANGDRVIGTVAAISPEGLIIDTQAAGRLRIAPKAVRSVSLGGAEDALLESAFCDGQTDPWVIRDPQAWSLVDGALVCSKRKNINTPVYAKLDQKEAVTMVAKVQALEGDQYWCYLALGGDASDFRQGNSLSAGFRPGCVRFQTWSSGGLLDCGDHAVRGGRGGGVLRLAYDPATGKAKMWVDDAYVCELDVTPRLPVCQYAMLDSTGPLKVEYVKVLGGIVPPSGDGADAAAWAAPAAPDDASVAVRFANKDRVSALKAAMADGQMVLTTPYGEIKCPPGSVSRLVFGKKGIEEPARAKADASVRAGPCRMTLQFDRLTADEVVGRSDIYGGEVRIRRDAVEEIRFNACK